MSMSTKQLRTVAEALTIGLVAALFGLFTYRAHALRAENKAARFDLACRTVHVALVEKARELDDPRQREHAFQDLTHSQTGVSYRELDWCLFDQAGTRLPAGWHDQRSQCLATSDYACLAANLRVAAALLEEDP